jgi:DNA transformation protein
MAVSEEYIAYIVDQLALFGEITPRKMFGGVGVFHDGLIFALIGHGDLYFKVDDENRKDFEEAGMNPFKPNPHKDEVMQYYRVPADVLENREVLAKWAAKAYAVALRKRK